MCHRMERCNDFNVSLLVFWKPFQLNSVCQIKSKPSQDWKVLSESRTVTYFGRHWLIFSAAHLSITSLELPFKIITTEDLNSWYVCHKISHNSAGKLELKGQLEMCCCVNVPEAPLFSWEKLISLISLIASIAPCLFLIQLRSRLFCPLASANVSPQMEADKSRQQKLTLDIFFIPLGIYFVSTWSLLVQ